jgi:hypothetical protein
VLREKTALNWCIDYSYESEIKLNIATNFRSRAVVICIGIMRASATTGVISPHVRGANTSPRSKPSAKDRARSGPQPQPRRAPRLQRCRWFSSANAVNDALAVDGNSRPKFPCGYNGSIMRPVNNPNRSYQLFR